MENRSSWPRMAVALFDKAAAQPGEERRQRQDAMFWLRGGRTEAAEIPDEDWTAASRVDQVKS